MRRFMVAAAALVAVLAAAVGGAGAAGGGLGVHVYTTKITTGPAQAHGTWILTIAPPVFHMTRNHALVEAGGVTITGSQVRFHETAGFLGCSPLQATAVYAWKLAGATLTFRRIGDTCALRTTVLSHTFTKTA